jgi:hypothetical protein
MTFKLKKVKVINLDNILKDISFDIIKEDKIFNNIYNKTTSYSNRIFLDKLIQYYLMIKLSNINKKQNIGQKTVILVQPYTNQSIDVLEGSTGELTYKSIKSFIKKIQSLIPLYFYFLDNNNDLNNVNYIEDLSKQTDLYYSLLELTNVDKEYKIKKLKAFLLKSGFKSLT